MDDVRLGDTRVIGSSIAGRYRIVEVIGSGGMGEVFLAEQEALGRQVAIKVIKRRFADEPEAVARFVREAKVVAQLKHPNIVTVHDFGKLEDGGLYIAMEYLTGQNLTQLQASGPVPWPQTLSVIRQAASALHAAHEVGIVHRDLKPDNIMVTQAGGAQLVKVLDFGVAKLANTTAQTHLTGSGILLGTPGYMAPETLTDEAPQSVASDLYALGLVWLEMLMGRRIYKTQTPAAMLVAQANNPPPKLADAMPERGVPVEVERVLYRLLDRDPMKRPPTAQHLVSEIDQLGQSAGMPPVDLGAYASPTPTPGSGVQGTIPLGSTHGSLSSSASADALASPPPALSLPPHAPTQAQTVPATPHTPGGGTLGYAPMATAPHTGPAPTYITTGPYEPGGRKIGIGMAVGALVLGVIISGVVIGAFVLGQQSAGPADMPTPMPVAAAAPVEASPPEAPAPSAPPPSAPPQAAAEQEPEKPGAVARASEPAPPPKATTKTSTKRRSKSTKRSSKKRRVAKKEPAPAAPAEPAAPTKPVLTSAFLQDALFSQMGKAVSCTNTVIGQHPREQTGLLVDHCPSYPEIDPDQRLSLVIGEDGHVQHASFASSEANQSKIGRCIIKSVKHWKFPAFDNGGASAKLKPRVKFKECLPINGKCRFTPPKRL